MNADTTQRSPLARLLAYAGTRRGAVRRGVVWSVLNKVFDLAPPFLIGTAVDVVVQREESFLAQLGWPDPSDQLIVLAVITVAVWAAESVLEYAQRITWRSLAQTVQHDLRMDAYAHVQGLEMAWFEDRSTGGLLAVLNDDVNQLERFLDGGADELIQMLTAVVVIGVAYFAIAPEVAWWSVIPMPLILGGSLWFQRRLAPRYGNVREQAARLAGLLSNNLGGIATIKSYTAEDEEVARVEAASDEYRSANYEAIRLSSAFSPLIRMVIVFGFTATLIHGGRLALSGELNVGLYGMMVFLTQRLLWPLTRLGATLDMYQRAMASTTRVLDLLDTEPKILSGERSLARDDVRGEIMFDDVSFAYGDGAPVLDGLSLRFPAGSTSAIVGGTGSGKTTVVKLLLRFYDATSGTITLDGHDVRELRLSDLRDAVGLVSQDVYLFGGSVRENVAYGAGDATDEQIAEALDASESSGFVAALRDTVHTVVGERGQKLSGGQRQRLSIARAVVKDPPVLVLDEATSSVDNETEAAIQRGVARIARGRTMIVIAHRLSTIRAADHIHVLDGGRVVESGTHDELIAHDGLYAQLWAVQTGEVAVS